MKEILITKKEEGERLDRLLRHYLPAAGSGFFYRMIRKKNITVNRARAEAAQHLQAGDRIQLWLSDETLQKFGTSSGQTEVCLPERTEKTAGSAAAVGHGAKPVRTTKTTAALDIVYEDEDILFVNKPAGMLSQKASPEDVSLCEYLIAYLLQENKITEEQLRMFRPSVCNRLDRGTSGLVACGVSMRGLQQMSELIRTRQVRKFYRCLAAGRLEQAQRLDGWLLKDEASNTVSILDHPREGAKRIVTEYVPLDTGKSGSVEWTYLEVELITGRSHQIRAHLSSIGHPLLGDRRYGNRKINAQLESRFGLRDQLLHACRMEFPKQPADQQPDDCGGQAVRGKAERREIASAMAGKIIGAPIPIQFKQIMDNSPVEKNGRSSRMNR